jgi:uncharacterized protein (DUF927 family)
MTTNENTELVKRWEKLTTLDSGIRRNDDGGLREKRRISTCAGMTTEGFGKAPDFRFPESDDYERE